MKRSGGSGYNGQEKTGRVAVLGDCKLSFNLNTMIPPTPKMRQINSGI
jgi:hypothetical protein